MELNTLNNIIKYIFLIGIIATLVYIVFYMRRINTGGWSITENDGTLSFTSPNNTMVFRISEKDNSIIVKDHTIKSTPTDLEFIDKSNNKISSINGRDLTIGRLTISDTLDNERPELRGVKFKNNTLQKDISYISDFGMFWPQQNMYLKIDHGPRSPQFQLHDLTNRKIVFQAPDRVSGDIEIRSYY